MRVNLAKNVPLIVSQKGHIVSAKQTVSSADTKVEVPIRQEWTALQAPVAQESATAFPWDISGQS